MCPPPSDNVLNAPPLRRVVAKRRANSCLANRGAGVKSALRNVCCHPPSTRFRSASARKANSRLWIRYSVDRGIEPGPYTPRPQRRTLPYRISHRSASEIDFDGRPANSKPYRLSARTNSAMSARPCLARCIVSTYRSSTPRSCLELFTVRPSHDGQTPNATLGPMKAVTCTNAKLEVVDLPPRRPRRDSCSSTSCTCSPTARSPA
jgi:hypothetical protein